MALRKVRLSFTTAVGGAATAYAAESLRGRLVMARWNKGTCSNGVDPTLSYDNEDGDNIALLTVANADADASYYPRVQVHSGVDGSALTLDGTRLMVEPPLVDGLLKLVIAAGGDAKVGNMTVYIEQ